MRPNCLSRSLSLHSGFGALESCIAGHVQSCEGQLSSRAHLACSTSERLLSDRSSMGLLQTMISQPEEVAPLLQMAWAAHKAKQLPKDSNLAFCYDMLNRVSRRYAPNKGVAR